MVPSKFDELPFLSTSSKQNSYSVSNAATQSNTVIAEGREKQNKRSPGCLITALGSDEEINLQTKGTEDTAGTHRERPWPFIGKVGSGAESVLQIA